MKISKHHSNCKKNGWVVARKTREERMSLTSGEMLRVTPGYREASVSERQLRAPRREGVSESRPQVNAQERPVT